MPEIFGTHHTKMMVLLRHDDMAQIVIHTANMIQRDWTNMTQAIWRSPLLPISLTKGTVSTNPAFGSGQKFKIDFLSYLDAYDTRRNVCKDLIKSLEDYDFSEIKGTLIGSVPGRHAIDSQHQTLWGWPALRKALEDIPVQEGESQVVVQVSSIATLGVTNQWLDKTLFKSLRGSRMGPSHLPTPEFKIIFPAPDEIRRCLDGYTAGASIHTKIQSGPQVKQLQYLKPLLHHWAGDGAQHSSGLNPSLPNL
jgi:tyrosyl-DNA phosphodiesterase-1